MQKQRMHVDHNCQEQVGGFLRFRDLTGEIISKMSPAEIEDLTGALITGFYVGGDPRCWEGFDEIPDEAKAILSMQYEIRMEVDPPDLGFAEATPLQ